MSKIQKVILRLLRSVSRACHFTRRRLLVDNISSHGKKGVARYVIAANFGGGCFPCSIKTPKNNVSKTTKEMKKVTERGAGQCRWRARFSDF